MKKLLSLLAAFCLILSLAPIGALAAEPAATLLFDLSLDGSTTTMPAVSNKVVTDRVTSVHMDNLYNETTEDLPLYKEEAGGNVKYLRFSYLDDSNTAVNKGSQVNVIFSSGDLADKDKLTFEMWARPTSYSAWSSMFALAFPGGNNEAFVMRMMTTPDYSFYPDRNANSAGRCYNYSSGVKDHINAWNHYVVTREWDSTAGGWKSIMYVNGAEFASGTYTCTKTTYATASTSSTTWNSFVIGNTTGNDKNKAFEGDIAEFRIYEGALTEAEAAAEFEDTKAPYRTIPDSLIFDMDISDSTEAIANNTETEEDETVAQKLVIKDTSNSGQVKNILPYGDSTSYAPTFVADDEGLQYLTFATADQASSARKMKVAVELSNAGLEDKTGITFEAWARAKNGGDTTKWSALASLGKANLTDSSHIEIRFVQSGKINMFPNRADGANNYASELGDFVASGNAGEWKHYVFVREWVTVEGEGQWKLSMYVNGALVNTVYNTAAGRTDDSVERKWLSIGGSSSQDDRGFIGDIADFRLYSKSLSENEVKASFNADANKYVSSNIDIVWKSGDDTLDSTVDIADLTSATAEITVTDYAGTAPYIFVAAYNGTELIDVSRAEYVISGTTVTATGTITWEASDGVDTVKAFIWNDGMSPLCQQQGL